MTPLLFALVLLAAVLHATWNALLRGGPDRLRAMTLMSFATTAASIPWAASVPLPDAAAWPWLVASALLQTGYSVFLVLAYDTGDLGQVYPVARGSAPLLVTLAAVVAAGEMPGWPMAAGIALVSAGLLGLVRKLDSASRRAVLLALATGAVIATYTTIDGIGVRRAGGSGGYAAWMFLIYGAVLPVVCVAIRGWGGLSLRGGHSVRALGGGLLSLLTYGTVTFAMTRAPIGAVSALRETSVVFAAVIGHLFLGERLTRWRLLACAAVAAGVGLLGW